MVNPEVAAVSCHDCKTYMYSSDWKPSMRAGIKNKRPAGVPTPCDTCPKIPSDMAKNWSNACDTKEVKKVLNHYLECRAVGKFPDDPIVRLHARIIRSVYDEFEQINGIRLMSRLGVAT